MTHRNNIKTLNREIVLRNLSKYRTVRPENHMYVQSLNTLLEGVICTSERRKLMRLWFMQLAPNEGYAMLPVNRRWCWNTKDADLQHLLSVGFIKVVRCNHGKSKTSDDNKQKRSGAFRTYLTLNKDKIES